MIVHVPQGPININFNIKFNDPNKSWRSHSRKRQVKISILENAHVEASICL